MRFLFAVFISLLFVSCSEKPNRKKPEGLLSEEKMVELLTDIQLIEGAVSKKILDKIDAKKESPIYYQKAFEKHDVTENQFELSIRYYTENPEDLQVIYEDVLIELSKIKAELQKAKQESASRIN